MVTKTNLQLIASLDTFVCGLQEEKIPNQEILEVLKEYTEIFEEFICYEPWRIHIHTSWAMSSM